MGYAWAVWFAKKRNGRSTDPYVGVGYPCAGHESANASKDFDSNPLVTIFDENFGMEEPIGSLKKNNI